jgi:hypothetical protein
MSPGCHSHKKAANWPFWLLVAAWWCANTPQAATFEVIMWLKGAAQYSHQAELRDDVAAVLTGAPQAARAQAHLGKLGRETPPPEVPLAKTLTIKRVSLCLQEERITSGRPDTGVAFRVEQASVPQRRTSPPRLRPPRLA